jgi:nucleoside-diphosphate-sugar epimerase
MRILVTGASGFIGRNLLLKIPKKWDVVATYNKSRDFTQFITKNTLQNVQAVKVNLTNRRHTKKKLENSFDCMVHLAANTDVALCMRNPQKDLMLNVMTLLNTVKATNVEDLIFMSSGAVYEGHTGAVSPSISVRPSLPYAISKIACENYVSFFKKKGWIKDYVILRFFGAYGPYEPARKIFTKLVKTFYFEKSQEVTIIGDGNNLVDAMYVEDAAEGILSVVRSNVRNVTVDFSFGNPLTIEELIQKVAKIFGQANPKLKYRGTPIEYNTFFTNDNRMETIYAFKPLTPLEVGIWKLAKWLERKSA